MAGSEVNEKVHKLNIDKFESNLVNNVIPKPKEFHESSRRSAHS